MAGRHFFTVQNCIMLVFLAMPGVIAYNVGDMRRPVQKAAGFCRRKMQTEVLARFAGKQKVLQYGLQEEFDESGKDCCN
ncbi:MAG TPA: hypothetical protein IAB24_04305 [Candidatus Copromonas avistercoris]|nr:hypothetical protein [Candidatus Copromonas avistercoris]